MITCILCGEQFKYISWKHLHYEHGISVEQYQELGGITGNEKTCAICGKIFIPSTRKQQYCSRQCSRKKCSIASGNRRFSHTEETKQKISENNARYWQGKKRPGTGKKIAAKLKGRRNAALAGRKFPGRRNSGQFGQREAWNKGKRMTPEYCENVRQGMIANGAIRYGERNPSWKGGVTPENAKYRKSEEYAKWRDEVFLRDNFACRICGQVGGNIVAHHIKRWADYPDLRFDVNNGLTMCRAHHTSIHARRYPDNGSIEEVLQIIIAAF